MPVHLVSKNVSYVSVSVNREFIQCIVTKATNALYALAGREKESFQAASELSEERLESLRSSGSVFQTVEPATAKARRQNMERR